ncbi:MAG TPA: two-component regulator propeller domain-containing protein [Candidatus Polarisedimenticolaceae bacterium]|nr:two-component regulator propeller domain-containing protein [Candidatus Polarisedimenticolaceae bacterium]
MATLVLSSAALASAPHFERVGSESGPPSEVVTALHQDRMGFVWIGSRTGLALYDGHAFTSFGHDPSDPATISDDAIRTIGEDRQGNLWVGTNAGGLNRLDRATWKFESFRRRSGDPGSLSHDSVYAIAEDREGALWVGTQRGLNRFDPRTRRFETFLPDGYVSSLLVDRAGRLWVGTVGAGLHRYDPATRSFEVWRHDAADPGSLADDSVFCLLEQSGGGLWVGTNGGLDRMETDQRTFRHFPLGHPVVTALAVGTDGRIWAGTFGGGVDALDAATGKRETFRHAPLRRGSLPSDRVLALLADHAGALWVGTWGGGLSRVSGAGFLLMAGADAAPEPEKLPDRDVTGLARDDAGGLWIGLRNGTLLRKEPGGGYRTYALAGAGSILCIVPLPQGEVWAGTSKGIVRLDARAGTWSLLQHDPKDAGSLGPGYVPIIQEAGADRFWVGTGEGGLQELSRQGRVLRRFVHDASRRDSLSDDYVTAIRQDRRGTLWVGTRSGGLNAVDPGTGRAATYRADPADPGTISSDNVTDLLEDARGRLWVATGGGGINRVDVAPDGRASFTRFTVADGLVDNNVMALLEDDDGSLWLSTKRGLSRFAPDRSAVTNYFVADGLPSSEFEFGAAVRNGAVLHFGSVHWVVSIPAGSPLRPAAPSPTVITSLRREGERAGDDRPPWGLSRIDIPYGRWFSIDLAVLDFTTEHGHAHAYRLGRKDEPWTDLGTRRTITFTDLDPGTYTFVGRGRNSQGVWTETAPPLAIRVVPPFWMTWWFRILAGGALLASAFASHRVRLSRLERRNRQLLELQAQRERASADLARAYERLQVLARRLEAAKEEERKDIARELHDDLGPTLTAVVINLQLIGVEKDAEKAKHRIADSIDLVDRMVQQIRDLSLDLRPPLLDEMGLVAALKGYLESQAQRTGIDIEVRSEKPLPELAPEVEITAFRVAQEAVTNAIRHAEAKRIDVTVEPVDGTLAIRVQDYGKGFDVQRSVDGSATGKSIGLLGMQERARMLGGDLRLDSVPGRGTTVQLRLPLEAKA